MSPSWIVLKFGGTSVADPNSWKSIAKMCVEHAQNGLRPFIVCSALSGVSDLLSRLSTHALQNTHAEILEEIKNRHVKFAHALSLNAAEILAEDFAELNRLALGVSLTRETSAALQARMMAFGELMLTRIAAHYLQQQKLSTAWLDARELLQSTDLSGVGPDKNFLVAICHYEPDSVLQKKLSVMPETILITQGFIASNAKKQTVLLGRGGSDTSAAYFAAKLQAVRCEIWTDVPGIYTANPKVVPTARLLRTLHFDEAREIASAGAKVLHPYCLDPVAEYGIPLCIRCTPHPEWEGTLISKDVPLVESQVKAISVKTGIVIVSMETAMMWHQVGFLSKIFGCFEHQGISVDLIATSENNVTVSLDSNRYIYSTEQLEALKKELQQYCMVKMIAPCAAVSLVGRNIRSILHKIAHVLEVFKEKNVYLLSQATNDLNLTLVIDEAESNELLHQIHALLFEESSAENMGSTWQHQQPACIPENLWWMQARAALLKLAEKKSPAYVYSRRALTQQAEKLKALTSISRLFYAMKANANPDILKLFYEHKLNFECVSQAEVERLFSLFPKIDPHRILFTPSFAPESEYVFGLQKKVWMNLDNLYPLKYWPQHFENQTVLLRIDPGLGRGHHQYVQTGGSHAKFGIAESQLDELQMLVQKHRVKVVGLHVHFGSGVMEEESWSEVAIFLTKMAKRFPEVRILDLGGGLGVPDHFGEAELNLSKLNETLLPIQKAYPQFELWMEPGRYLVAQSGVLLATVTQLKQKGGVQYVGVDAGMNSLIRPCLYNAYHEIVNLTRIEDSRSEVAHVVGPICETGDTLGYSRSLPKTLGGDVFLIANAGAYGYAMSSHYNLREPAEEIFLD